MITILIPFTILWTLCSSARHYNELYYHYNTTRATISGIAAYRSALTLDWLAAEDQRQREMVAAIESEPLPFPALHMNGRHSDCIAYARPTSGSVARLMLELLKNLEGDDGTLIPSLIKALVRAKLLVLDSSMFENEPDLDALVKTPAAMIGEPHTTFPRILSTIWMAVTDPSTVKKHGWCTVSKMTAFLLASRPSEIARQMRAVDPIVSRARFIMEEFIQHVTPLNMIQREREKLVNSPTPTKKAPTPHPVLPNARYKPYENGLVYKPQAGGQPIDQIASKNKRPVRTYPIMAPVNRVSAMPQLRLSTQPLDSTHMSLQNMLPREYLVRASSSLTQPPLFILIAVSVFVL